MNLLTEQKRSVALKRTLDTLLTSMVEGIGMPRSNIFGKSPPPDNVLFLLLQSTIFYCHILSSIIKT